MAGSVCNNSFASSKVSKLSKFVNPLPNDLFNTKDLQIQKIIEAADELGANPLELALHGGEDYAVLVAAPPGERLAGFSPIGRCAARDGCAARDDTDTSVALLSEDGSSRPVWVCR